VGERRKRWEKGEKGREKGGKGDKRRRTSNLIKVKVIILQSINKFLHINVLSYIVLCSILI
jgi:hypothetical protein